MSISTGFYSSVTFTSGDKMISRGISSNGTNPYTSISGSDYIEGEDGLANNITSANLFIGWRSIYNLKISWSIASQTNNNHKYIPKHNKDGIGFSSIGEIDDDGTRNEKKY